MGSGPRQKKRGERGWRVTLTKPHSPGHGAALEGSWICLGIGLRPRVRIDRERCESLHARRARGTRRGARPDSNRHLARPRVQRSAAEGDVPGGPVRRPERLFSSLSSVGAPAHGPPFTGRGFGSDSPLKQPTCRIPGPAARFRPPRDHRFLNVLTDQRMWIRPFRRPPPAPAVRMGSRHRAAVSRR